jgi:hypothetical protein
MRGSLLALAVFSAAVVQAHVVSMSTGELRVDGPTAVYELRMPMYEVAHVKNPETTLLDHVRFDSGHRTRSSCLQDGDTYICTAGYEFPELMPVKLDVECTLFQVTVPNHIHLLTAVQGKNGDQVVFDQATLQNEVRFRPPSPAEVFFRDITRGAWRLLTSVGALLFLAGIGIAAKTWRDAAGFAVALLVAEWLSPALAGKLPVTLSPQFFEAGLALALSYLAMEILFLPDGAGRWVAVIAAGAFEGISYAGFPKNYLTGANIVQIAVLAACTLAALRLLQKMRRPMAWGMMAAGLAWFGTRLIR